MKLGLNHADSGTVRTERVLKQNGKEKKTLVRENKTEGLGPFSREENPARVGATVGATLSRNYHTVTVQVSVNIPAHATEAGVDEGIAWCFNKAGDVLNEQLKGANRALDKLSTEKKT
jgi:hypothetical protein